MPRPKSPTLTEAELRLMEVVWERGECTVGQVVKALPKGGAVAYSTVLTTLRILERKGYLRHEKRGKAFVYAPVVGRGDARRKVVRYLISRFFQNSPELLVLNVLEHEKIDPAEWERLKEMIDKEG